MQDNRTLRGYRLTASTNKLLEDQPRINQSLTQIDSEMTAVEGRATALEQGMVTASGRITSTETSIASLGGRMTTAESAIGGLQSDTANNVRLTGNQTVAGTKTFSDAPVVPDLAGGDTTSGKAANAKSASALIAAALAAFLPTGLGPLPWSLPTLPAGGWVWADGSVLLAGSNTALRQAYIDAGFPYGQDGSGNPKLPDLRGRIPAGKDNMGGTAAGRLTTAVSGVDGTTLGASGGEQAHTLTLAEVPAHSHTVSGATASPGSAGTNDVRSSGTAAGVAPTTDSKGGGGAHNNVQPTVVCNYIIKA